jgi:hypothetical protein
MTNATNLHGNSNNSKMREAMRLLGSQFGIKDKNSFVQILLMGATSTGDGTLGADDLSEASRETNSSLENLADAIISLQGDGLFSDQVQEIFENYIASAGTSDDVAAALFSEPPANGKCSPITFTPSESLSTPRGYLRSVGVKDIVPDIEQHITYGDNHRSIGVIEFHHPNLNFSNRDSAAASIFLQALPSIEISKAVPYFDMKTIVKGAPVADENNMPDNPDVFTNGISIYKFLHGEKIESSNSTVAYLASSVPSEFANPAPILEGGVGQAPATKPGVSVAGMEIFTSPQTLVNGALEYIDLDASASNYGPNASPQDIPLENKVLDKFRPLMTIKSFNVQVTPATGMLATKAADVKLTLHDKSRMNQIMPLIMPGQLGDVEFLIEWGWSHPHSDPDVNPYGALINSMRCKEKYGVMNSSYSFTPEGQVEISLKLYTKGAQKATFELVSSNPDGELPGDQLRKLVFAIREAMKSLKQQGYTLNSEMGAPDVLGKASSVGGLLSLTSDQKRSIRDFLTRMRNRSSGAAAATWGSLVTGFSEAAEGAEDFQTQILAQFASMINSCTRRINTTPDPYLLPDRKLVSGIRSPVLDIKYETHVSFAKVLLNFVAKPLLATDRFHEVQLLFYPMNEFAMFARDLNTGQYPINKKQFKDLFEEELKKTPSISIQKFLNIMKKLFINYVGDDVYGLSQFYATGEDGKRGLAKAYTKDDSAKQKFTEKKVKILEACYGAGNEKRFKKPSIQMWVECVAHSEKPDYTILRLHFFDKACTSYSGYAQMWAGSSAGDLGVIGRYTAAKRSEEHAQRQIGSVPASERENWEEIARTRAQRVTQHEQNAMAQMQEFLSNGLLEAFSVNVPELDEGGNPTGDTIPVDKYRIKGGPDQLRGILAANMPTLKYGTEYSGILNASLATMSNPAMETIHMQRQGQNSGPAGAVDDGLPMQIKPVDLSLDTFGCPYINFGQQFFIDFQTNTSIDDIYAVSGVSHSLTPSEFKTSIKMSPLNKLGQFRAMTDQFDDAMAVAGEVGENIEE